MEELLKRVDELVTKLGTVAQQHGPEAFELVTTIYQMKAISAMLSPFGALAFAAGLWYFIVRPLWPGVMALWKNAEDGTAGPTAVGSIGIAAALIGAGVGAAVGVSGLIERVLNPLYWMAALDGKFALAAYILKAI